MSDEKPKEEVTEEALKFAFSPATEKPTRKYRKGSKYDVIIEAFIKSGERLSQVQVQGKTGVYLQGQLNKRIDATPEWKHVEVSTANSQCYLENTKIKPKK